MLTPDDLRNPKRKSGYDYVGYHPAKGKGGKPRYHGQRNGATGPGLGAGWMGPDRDTAVAAAWDSCRYIASLPPLTPDDLKDPSNASGYKYVGSARGGGSKRGTIDATERWRAQVGQRHANKPATYRSKSYYDPRAACQDYCDYINAREGRGSSPRIPVSPGQIYTVSGILSKTGSAQSTVTGKVITDAEKLRFVSHPRKPRKAGDAPRRTTPTVEKEGPGYVYLVGMIGNLLAVKIGESRDEPQYRLAGIQTGNPWEVYVITFVKAKRRIELERTLHRRFAHLQLGTLLVGEWFTPHKSIFNYFNVQDPADAVAGLTKEVIAS